MIYSFDGNVYTGKTSIGKMLSRKYGFNFIEEHSLFVDIIKRNNLIKNEYLNEQVRYLDVDKYRIKCLKGGVNILDRSVISISAHVYAIYKLGLVDIRTDYFNFLKKKIDNIILPDVFVVVNCVYPTVLKRCIKLNNPKQTERIYLSEDYYNCISRFNNRWLSLISGIAINTDTELSETLLCDIYNQMEKESRKNRPATKRDVILNNIHRCLFM